MKVLLITMILTISAPTLSNLLSQVDCNKTIYMYNYRLWKNGIIYGVKKFGVICVVHEHSSRGLTLVMITTFL